MEEFVYLIVFSCAYYVIAVLFVLVKFQFVPGLDFLMMNMLLAAVV